MRVLKIQLILIERIESWVQYLPASIASRMKLLLEEWRDRVKLQMMQEVDRVKKEVNGLRKGNLRNAVYCKQIEELSTKEAIIYILSNKFLLYKMQSELLLSAQATLGEGPSWDAKTQTLYWVDILEKRLYAGTEILAQLDDLIGCLAPCKNGHLILGKRLAFSDLDPATNKLTTLASLETEPANNRINDGKCDPKGRFLAGTMDINEKEASGSLYSFDGKAITCLLDGIRISNGLAWSPDYKIFYYIDTPTRKVIAFDYDLVTGQIANQRIAIEVPESLGWPDGMTSDTEGNLWIALWGGAQITRWNPNTGRLLDQISVPVLQPSSCVFGGRDMNELYVTSARKGMSEADLIRYPLSGGLFKIKTEVEGMQTFEFR